MVRLRMAVERLVRDERGQDLMEYALVVVLIAVATVLALGTVGSTVVRVLWTPIGPAI